MAEAEKTNEELDAEQLQKDVESFNAKLVPLLGEFTVGLGATAFITPDGRIGARPVVFRAPDQKKEAAAPAVQAESSPTADAAPAADVTGSDQ